MARGTLGEQFGMFGPSNETIGVRIMFDVTIEIMHPWGPEYVNTEQSVTVNALASDTIAEVMARANEYAAEGHLGERHGGSPTGEITGSELTGLFLGGYTDPAINMT